MEWVLGVYTLSKAGEEMITTVGESNSDDTNCKTPLPSESAAKLSFDTKKR